MKCRFHFSSIQIKLEDARAVKILKANDIADTELKRHGKGLKEAVDKTITI